MQVRFRFVEKGINVSPEVVANQNIAIGMPRSMPQDQFPMAFL